MEKKLVVKTFSGAEILVDITDDACWKFGFFHGEIVFNSNKNEKVKIIGVAPGEDGDLRLWFTNHNSKGLGPIDYWVGEKNLSKAGFTLPLKEVTHVYPSDIPNDSTHVLPLPYFIKRGGKFFAGTDRHPLFLSDLKQWVSNGEVKPLKSPIVLKNTESLFISGGKTPIIYIRFFIDKEKNFKHVGKYKDLIL